MTTIGSVGAAPCMPSLGGPAAASSADGGIGGLPAPLFDGGEPTDVLGMMMAAVERMSSISGDESEKRIQNNQKKLDNAVDEFMDRIADALEAARKAAQAKKKKKGFFGKIASSVGKLCAKAVGAAVDFMKDVAVAPFEIGYKVAMNAKDPLNAFKNALDEQFTQMTTNGSWAASVEGFTQGVMQFSADFADFAVAYTAACAQAGLAGEGSAFNALKNEATKLWDSFSDNILTNEGFWDVVEPVAKAAAVAGAVASGGALSFLAVGAMMLLEADSKTGFLSEAVGADAAEYVRVGLALGAAACVAAGDADLAKLARYVGGTAKVLEGVATIEEARLELKEAKLVKQDALREADMQQTLHRVRMLHELADDLIEAYAEVSEGKKSNHAMFQSLSQAQSNCEAATVFRA